MFKVIIKDTTTLELLSGVLFLFLKKFCSVFIVLLNNFIFIHLKSTHIVWVVFLYSFKSKVSVYAKWSKEFFPLKIS